MRRMQCGRDDATPHARTSLGLHQQRGDDYGSVSDDDASRRALVIGCGQRGLRDGAAACAAMHRPYGVCAFQLGGATTLAFTDCYNNAIRLVLNADSVSAAGSVVISIDNTGLLKPRGICVSDDYQYLFVCDTGHHRVKFATLPSSVDAIHDSAGMPRRRDFLRRSIEMFSFAGSGDKTWKDGPVLQAGFNSPAGVCEGSDGTIFVADTGNHCIRAIRRSAAVGGGLIVTTIAGGLRQLTELPVGQSRAGHKDGDAHEALFRSPSSVIEGPFGELLVADTMNHCIRALIPTNANGIEAWEVSTVCGRAQRSGYRDGSCATALFCKPIALCRGPRGSIFVSDAGNNCIRQIGTMSRVSTRLGYLPYASVRSFHLDTGIMRPIGGGQQAKEELAVLGLVYTPRGTSNAVDTSSDGDLWLCNPSANCIQQIRVAEVSLDTETRRGKLHLTRNQQRVASPVTSDISSSDIRSVRSGYTASSSSSACDESTMSSSSSCRLTKETLPRRDRPSKKTSKLSDHNATLRHQNDSLRQLLQKTLAEIASVTSMMAEVQSSPAQRDRQTGRHTPTRTSIQLH